RIAAHRGARRTRARGLLALMGPALDGRTGTVVALPAATRLGAVRLRVRDLETEARFYRETLGLREQQRTRAGVTLSAADDTPLLVLEHVADAPRRPARTTGLYHFALLFPDRPSLGAAIRDVAAADHA